jgi:hypothetical protein
MIYHEDRIKCDYCTHNLPHMGKLPRGWRTDGEAHCCETAVCVSKFQREVVNRADNQESR